MSHRSRYQEIRHSFDSLFNRIEAALQLKPAFPNPNDHYSVSFDQQRDFATPAINSVEESTKLRELSTKVKSSRQGFDSGEGGSVDRIDRILNLVNSSFSKIDTINQAVF